MQIVFNVERLLEDVGGPTVASTAAGVPRSAPYRWKRNGHVSTRYLARLKRAFPSLSIDQYFEEEEANGGSVAAS